MRSLARNPQDSERRAANLIRSLSVRHRTTVCGGLIYGTFGFALFLPNFRASDLIILRDATAVAKFEARFG